MAAASAAFPVDAFVSLTNANSAGGAFRITIVSLDGGHQP